MAFATNGEICISYERMTAGDGPAVILLAGAGRPSTDFDYHFCAPLFAAGFVPIRIDSRDTRPIDGADRCRSRFAGDQGRRAGRREWSSAL